MQPRMKDSVAVLPDALQALLALDRSAAGGVPYATRKLVHLRASQINGVTTRQAAGAWAG